MNNDINVLGMRAETLGIYAVQGKDSRVTYFYNDGEYAIRTAGFVLRLSEQEAEAIATGGFKEVVKSSVAKELGGVIRDVKYLRRVGVRS